MVTKCEGGLANDRRARRWEGDGTPEIRKILLKLSQVYYGCVMTGRRARRRRCFLNRSQVKDDATMGA